jgi:hypothetical protein
MFDGRDTQDELYLGHRSRWIFPFPDGPREVCEGDVVHAESTTRRMITNAGNEDLLRFVVGGSGGYVRSIVHSQRPTSLG